MSSSRKELTTALLKLVEEAKDSQTLAKSVAAFLIAERRTKELDSLLRSIEQARFDKYGSLEVHATSATPLTKEAKNQIKQLFRADKIQIHEDQDPGLLGGVRLRALDKVADLSVSSKLNRLRQGSIK